MLLSILATSFAWLTLEPDVEHVDVPSRILGVNFPESNFGNRGSSDRLLGEPSSGDMARAWHRARSKISEDS